MSEVEVASLGAMIPVSTELLEDVQIVAASRKTIAHILIRDATAEWFGEKWSSAEEEIQRLEHGRLFTWDRTVVDDTCPECGCAGECGA